MTANGFLKRLIAGFCLAVMMTGGAAAQLKSAVTASELEAILTGAGLQTTMTRDAATGAPVANGKLGELTFWVRALDCAGAPPACENLVFFANFDLGRSASQKDFRVVNSFNDGQLFGRAYVLESKSQVGIEYVIELGGGVSMDHITTNVSRWADIVSTFIDKFRAGQGSS